MTRPRDLPTDLQRDKSRSTETPSERFCRVAISLRFAFASCANWQMTAFVKATEQAEKFRDGLDRRQRFN